MSLWHFFSFQNRKDKKNLLLLQKKINITNFEQIRYYNDIKTVTQCITDNLDLKNKIIDPPLVLKIKLDTMYKAFKTIFPDCEINIIGDREYEKICEEINLKDISSAFIGNVEDVVFLEILRIP